MNAGIVLPKVVLVQVLLRSFLLQASWNFERLQNLGFLFVLAPALRFLYRGDELQAAYARHLEYFNTHPFLAAPVLGTVLHLEERLARGEENALGVQEFKRMTMAPYAAMRDALFWGGIRPLSAGVALFIAAKGSLFAPLVFLLLFNLPHLWFRTSGVLRGYAKGIGVVQAVQRIRLPDLAVRCKEGTVVLLGGLTAYLTHLTLLAEGRSTVWGLLVIPAVLVWGWLARKGFSALLLALASSALLLALSQLLR
jgi:PTS system mannose-specific IID component